MNWLCFGSCTVRTILNDFVENLSRLPEREEKLSRKKRFPVPRKKNDFWRWSFFFKFNSREKLNWFNFIASSVIDDCGRILIYFRILFRRKINPCWMEWRCIELIINDEVGGNWDFMSRSWIVERKTTFRGITYDAMCRTKKL